MNTIKLALAALLIASSTAGFAVDTAPRDQRMNETLEQYRANRDNAQTGPMARGERAMKRGSHRMEEGMEHGAHKAKHAMHHDRHHKKHHAKHHRAMKGR